MKKLYIVLFALVLGISFSTKAHDFFAVNSDGDTIYYYINSTGQYKVSVTFKGSTNLSYSDEYTGDITIPSSVEYNNITYSVSAIGINAFYNNSNITSINLPSTITSIGAYAFRNCSGLTSITIPENVVQILNNAFQNCSSLDTLYFNATNCNNLSSTNIYLGCNNLSTIIIGNNVTKIPSNAFYGCSAVTSINIPSSVNYFGQSAFRNCTSLKNINIPSTITSLPNNIFRNCDSLSSINIPSSVTSIGQYSFAECSSLDTIIIPSSVSSLDYNIFAYCYGLKFVSIPNSITYLPNYAFQDCISLTSISTPSVTSFGTGVFQGCTSLTSYTLPNNITNIPDYTFLGCTSLDSIIIPPSVLRIKFKAFQNCSSLTRINLPNSVTAIENYAFDGCSSLSEIYFPASLGSIGDYAFRYCSNLDTVFIDRTNPPTITWLTFHYVPTNINIILPCHSQLNYLNANNWSSFTNFKELDSCLYTINVESIDSTLGTVTGSGTFQFDTITITATSSQGSYFAGWQDGDTNSIRSVIVTKDSSFIAIFKEVVYSNIADTICQGQTYSFFGNNLTSEGFYSHTISVSQTRDSIINLQLKLNPTYSFDIYDTICEGETYTQYGFNTNLSGLTTLNLQTAKGCDSIINLYLTVNTDQTTNIQAAICQGQTYSLNGFNADTTGLYTLNLQTYKGCDSTVNLSLLVNPKYTIDIQGEVCEGKFYYQNGFFEHMSGIHTRYLQTTEGCDSIINLHLTVNPNFTDTIYDQICQGEVYSENGFNFSVDTSGLYSLNLQSINGCDSIINLHLTVKPIFSDTIYAQICHGEVYAENDFNVDSSGIYSQIFQSINGCDSIINLHLTVIQTPAPTNLTLNNITNYIELNWEGEQENYVIYRDNDSLTVTTLRIYQDSNVVEGVNYCYKIKALNGECESVFSNEECKTFLNINSISTNNFNAYLYPNPTSNKTILRVEGLNENALVRIYDITGRLIKTLELNANDKELEIDVENFAKGVYSIIIINSSINISTKFIKE